MLSQDVRAPVSRIAKRAGLSRDSVKYRIANYQKRGVIRRYVALVNTAKLGYDAYHVFLRLNNPTKEAEVTIIRSLERMPFVRAVLKFFGSYDLEIAVIARSLVEFDSFLSLIVSQTAKFIQDYEILIITHNYRSGAFPGSFFRGLKAGAQEFDVRKRRGKEQSYSPDGKDFRIIKAIRDDAQMSLAEIGARVGLSPDAVGYRLRRLKERIIVAFIPAINYHRIGYDVHALLLNISPLSPENEKTLHTFLANDERVLWAVKTIGRFNVLAYVCTRDENELQDTINKLRSHFPEEIKRYDSLLAYEEYKYTYAPDCVFENLEVDEQEGGT
jgi:DNA-binding Lrp family transcriptional regulator